MLKSWQTFDSKEQGQYIRFLLWLGNKLNNSTEECEKCRGHWGFGKHYPSDDEKHFGYKNKGMEAFF